MRDFIAESEESMVSSWNSDKAVVLPYYEIRDATSNFSASLKIGQGSYGSVYLGKLRGTVSESHFTKIILLKFVQELWKNFFNTLLLFICM